MSLGGPFTSVVSTGPRAVSFAGGEAFSVNQAQNEGPKTTGQVGFPFDFDQSYDNASHFGSGFPDTNGSVNHTIAIDTSQNRLDVFDEIGQNELLVIRRNPSNAVHCAHEAMSVSVFNYKMATMEWMNLWGMEHEAHDTNKTGLRTKRASNTREITKEFDIGRVQLHTNVENWQKTGDAQFVTTKQYRLAPLQNIWAVNYNSKFRGEHGAKGLVAENDYLWLVLKQFEFIPLDPAGLPYPMFYWQLVPLITSQPGAISPLYYTNDMATENEVTGTAIYVGRVHETIANEWKDREDHALAVRAVFPRAGLQNYKRAITELTTIKVVLGVN
jgi:hypothetical protein